MITKCVVRFLVAYLFSFGSYSAISMPSIDCSEHVERQNILARMMARDWFENKYFTQDTFKKVALIKFKGMSIAKDGSYYDRLVDPERHMVSRYSEELSDARENNIALSKEEFWKRVAYVEYLLENSALDYIRIIELIDVDRWWQSGGSSEAECALVNVLIKQKEIENLCITNE